MSRSKQSSLSSTTILALAMLFLGFSWCSKFAFAQEVKLRVGMEPQNPVLGERIIFGIVINRVSATRFSGTPPHEVKIPSGADYSLKFRETRSGQSSQRTTIMNGRRREYFEDSWTLIYDLVPSRAGVYQIPAFNFEVFGKDHRIGSLTFEVLKKAPGNRYATLEVTASPESPYVNQPVTLRMVITCDKPMVEVKSTIPWASNPNGFSGPVTELGWTGGRGAAVELNGQRFDFQRGNHPSLAEGERLIYERVLYPIAAGKVELEAVTLRMNAAIKMGRGVFGRRRVRESAKVVLVSKPLILDVRGAPMTGRPQSFTGVIGNFEGVLELGSTIIKAGDGFTLRLQLEGPGELASLTPPDLAAARGFDAFDVYAPDKAIEPGSGKGNQRMTISWLLVPKPEVQLKEFPPWEFSWFRPASETFETISLKATPVEIHGAVIDGGIIGGGLSAREARDSMTLGEGLRPIMTRPDLINSGVPRVSWFWFLSLLIAPGLLFAASKVLLSRRENLAGDLARQRRRRASKDATNRLNEAREHLNADRGFHGKLARSVTGFIGDKLDLPPARVSAATVCDLIGQAGGSDERASELAEFLQDLESREFGGGGASAVERQADLDRAEALIHALDREIKR